MGVQNGKFIPLNGYKEIEWQIKTYSKLAFKLNVNDVKKNKEFQSIIKDIETFIYLRPVNPPQQPRKTFKEPKIRHELDEGLN